MNGRPSRRRLQLFGLLALLAAGAIVVAITGARRERAAVAQQSALPAGPASAVAVQPAEPAASAPTASAAPDVPALPAAPAVSGTPRAAPKRIFFRNTALDARYGRLAYRDGESGELHLAGELSCEVAHVGRQVGICLVARRGVITRYFGRLFDAGSFAPQHEFALEGTPSRSRVSADGRRAALTVFLAGHGYDTLDFSTQTLILDAVTGERIADLEMDFTVEKDGVTIREQDFNFWGVTFPADSNVFYATLSTGGRHYLVRGDLEGRRMTVIHENVECPSVSPDGRRVAYKKRFREGGRIIWQLHVLDLASGRETGLAERRSIDDQLEWLDDGRVLYSVPSENQDAGGGTDVWVVRADGGGEPRLFIASAYSPAVVR